MERSGWLVVKSPGQWFRVTCMRGHGSVHVIIMLSNHGIIYSCIVNAVGAMSVPCETPWK